MSKMTIPSIPQAPMYVGETMTIEWQNFFRDLFVRIGEYEAPTIDELSDISNFNNFYSAPNLKGYNNKIREIETKLESLTSKSYDREIKELRAKIKVLPSPKDYDLLIRRLEKVMVVGLYKIVEVTNAVTAAADLTDEAIVVGDGGAKGVKELAIGGALAIPRMNAGGTALEFGIGGQIAFPATAVPSADPNMLDDYEEGDWTPGVEGSITAGDTTYSVQVGKYEKIGRQVTIRGRVTVGVQGTLDGNVSITGLPFTSNAEAQTFSAITFGHSSSLAITTGCSLGGIVPPNATTISVYVWDDAAGVTALDDAELTDGASMIFSGSYMV